MEPANVRDNLRCLLRTEEAVRTLEPRQLAFVREVHLQIVLPVEDVIAVRAEKLVP